ncbi:MAG: aminotransferase class I/II-fold pyridoxal phosphate-dependent enzyme, partial [Sphingobacteriaceae bacterium]|nr:aminotransferase class I/II-fold pyridoxal phosphate-dependent enzyme [Cytophagaceae bacterium]
MHLSEILNHLGEEREKYFHAVVPPVIQSSNFVFDTLADFRAAISDEFSHHIYTRGNNPTVEILRKKLAALEGAEDALALASGAGATAMAMIANLQAGQHVVCVQHPYSWTKHLLVNFLPRFGVSHTFVDGREVSEIEAAIRPETAVLYLESPNTMTFEIQDLRACVDLAKRHGLISMIDNSNCSPIFQRPIEHGIDLVIHTGSKYLNGHSDVMNGVICGSRQMIRKIFETEIMTLGNIVSPHDAWLVLRGLRTLDLRVRRSFESALRIATWLEGHPKVERVLFPLLPSFPQYELAKRQMSGCGGLITLFLKTDSLEAVERFFSKLQRFMLAVSWGGHESLVMPMAAFYGIENRPAPHYPFTLVRLYIGLEDTD